jgi:hypothetical protein
MNTTHSSIPVAEVPGYTELQREIHDALRAQHPEWIEADGKSRTCDYYEPRFTVLLLRHLTHARASNRTCLCRGESSMPIGYAEARNMVFPKSPALARSLFTEKKGIYEQNHQSN